MFNNHIYGMTGGQASPMTPSIKATTAPYGTVDRPFDACHLAEAAGATYVARSTAFHVKHLSDMIAADLITKDFLLFMLLFNVQLHLAVKTRWGMHRI